MIAKRVWNSYNYELWGKLLEKESISKKIEF